jgi:hypothetical protein
VADAFTVLTLRLNRQSTRQAGEVRYYFMSTPSKSQEVKCLALTRWRVVTTLGDQLQRQYGLRPLVLRQVCAEWRKERRANIKSMAVRFPARLPPVRAHLIAKSFMG